MLGSEIAAGGMATVVLARQIGDGGFARTVAVKRLHPHLAKDQEFSGLFVDEARLAARIRHPNVVPTLDVVAADGELLLVMEYVLGESLARLLRQLRHHDGRMPPRIAVAILVGALHGLHAAHEAKNERGEPLGLVHRDVSPQNVLVGADGVARVVDFGVAKALGRSHTTKDGQIKGKLGYMPPEQLRGAPVNRQADVYAAGVVLWEALTGERLFAGDNEAVVLGKALAGLVEPPSSRAPEVSAALDALVLRALSRDVGQRFSTAREMAMALERTVAPASTGEVAEWVEEVAGDLIAARAQKLAEMDRGEIQPDPPAAATEIAEPLPRSITSVSVATEPRRATAARRGVVAAALIVPALCVGVYLGTRSSPAPVVEAASAPPPAIASAPEASSATAVAEPAPPVASVAPIASVAPKPTSRAAPPKHASCSPKFTIDAQGIRHIKPECLNAP